MHVSTERLELRDVVMADVPAMHQFFGDRALTQFTNFYRPSESDTRRCIEDWIFHNNQRPRFAHNSAMVSHAGDEVIGWIGFGHAYHKSIGERSFGYALRRDEWNKGYMTEALTAVLAYCFGELAVASVFGAHRPQNPASGRVMEKVGLRYVGTFPSSSEAGVIERRFIAFQEEWLLGRDLSSVRIGAEANP
ncbi:MAG: GNAT family N-acetyltransferase [Chloroflexota bacterium]|nr:GNAT family N-acetyltransferase [Chloroflexota bacterium]